MYDMENGGVLLRLSAPPLRARRLGGRFIRNVRSPPSRRARGGGAELIFQLGHPYGKPLVLTRLDCASCGRGNFRPDELVYFIFNQFSIHNPRLLSQQVARGIEL